MSRRYIRKTANLAEQTALIKSMWTPEKRASHGSLLKCLFLKKRLSHVEPATRICIKCNIEKSSDFFPWQRGKARHTNCCKSCMNIRRTARELANPEKRDRYQAIRRDKETQRKKYMKNRMRYLAADKKNKQENPSYYRELRRQLALKNPGRTREKNRQHYLAKCRASPRWLSPIQRALIQEFYEVSIAKEIQTGIKYHVDHMVPLKGSSVCGLHVPWNLQVLTAADNVRKKNRLVIS